MVLPRPEERVPVDLDMRVWGMGADGHAFSPLLRLFSTPLIDTEKGEAKAQACEIA
jgi:hypothetical protein